MSLKDAKPRGQLSAADLRAAGEAIERAQPVVPTTGDLVPVFGHGGFSVTTDDADTFYGKITVKYQTSVIEPWQYGFTEYTLKKDGTWELTADGRLCNGQNNWAFAPPWVSPALADYWPMRRASINPDLFEIIAPHPQRFWVEITGNNGGTPRAYSWKKKIESSAGTWADASPAVTGSNNLYRAPSNTPSHPPTPSPPDIPNASVVEVWPSFTVAGIFETHAVGGLTEVAMKNQACEDGYLGGRDLYFTTTSPPPPPPVTAPAWYCVNNGSGGRICAQYTTTPPKGFFGGPYTTQSLCQASC